MARAGSGRLNNFRVSISVVLPGLRCFLHALPGKILTAGRLKPRGVGHRAVSFTTPPFVAAYFAGLEGDTDEGPGVIFVFDRKRLRRRLRVESWDEWPPELDEFVDREVTLRAALIGYVSEPFPTRSRAERRADFWARVRA
jgi:hypothetical protein